MKKNVKNNINTKLFVAPSVGTATGKGLLK